MTTMITELYEALKKAGVDDETARRAAQAVLGIEQREQLATKVDLAELKVDLIKWMIGLLFAQAAFVITLLKL